MDLRIAFVSPLQAVLIAGSLALAGCTAPPPQDACTVLTPEIAKSAIGNGADLKRRSKPNLAMTTCAYQSGFNDIEVDAGYWNTLGDSPFDKTPVSGIGDEAFLETDFTTLFVRKGHMGFSVEIRIDGPADGRDARNVAAEKAIAPQLLANLK